MDDVTYVNSRSFSVCDEAADAVFLRNVSIFLRNVSMFSAMSVYFSEMSVYFPEMSL